MRYHYESGFENFKAAQKTYIRSSWGRRVWFHFCLWGSLMLGIMTICGAALARVREPLGLVMAPLGGGLVALGLVSLISRPFQLRRVYKAWNGKQRTLHVYIEVDGETFISGIEGRSEGRFARSAVCKVIEDDEMLLLFLTAKRFFYLPKKVIHEAALAEVRHWLALPGAPASC